MTEAQISEVLWRVDPMHTSCNVNDAMKGEYVKEARWIADLLAVGMNAREAVVKVFNIWFEEGCMEGPREDYLNEIVRSLEENRDEPG